MHALASKGRPSIYVESAGPIKKMLGVFVRCVLYGLVYSTKHAESEVLNLARIGEQRAPIYIRRKCWPDKKIFDRAHLFQNYGHLCTIVLVYRIMFKC